MINKTIIRNPDIVWRNIGEEAVLLNQKSGGYFGLNGVGCSVWEKIDDRRTAAEIIQLLMHEYNVEETVLTRDVLELLEKMLTQGLIG